VNKQLENIQAVMRNLNFSIEQAMEVLNVLPEERAQYMEQLGMDTE